MPRAAGAVTEKADKGRAGIRRARMPMVKSKITSAAKSAVVGRIRVKKAARPGSGRTAAKPASGSARILTGTRPAESRMALSDEVDRKMEIARIVTTAVNSIPAKSDAAAVVITTALVSKTLLITGAR